MQFCGFMCNQQMNEKLKSMNQTYWNYGFWLPLECFNILYFISLNIQLNSLLSRLWKFHFKKCKHSTWKKMRERLWAYFLYGRVICIFCFVCCAKLKEKLGKWKIIMDHTRNMTNIVWERKIIINRVQIQISQLLHSASAWLKNVM